MNFESLLLKWMAGVAHSNPNRKPIEYSKNSKYDPMPAQLIATLKSLNFQMNQPNSTDSIKFILIFHWFTEHFRPEVMSLANAKCDGQTAAKGHLQTINKAKFQFVIAKLSLSRYRSVSINSIICFHQNRQKESCINYALHWFNNDESLLSMPCFCCRRLILMLLKRATSNWKYKWTKPIQACTHIVIIFINAWMRMRHTTRYRATERERERSKSCAYNGVNATDYT